MKKLPIFINICLFSLFPSLSYAEDDLDLGSLLSMDLDSLMDIEVTVASKRVEKITDAPSVLSVVTRADIDKFGARTLIDVLQRLPNVYGFGSYVFPNNATSIRNQYATSLSRHELLLINGRPIHSALYGGNNSIVLQSFPIDVIQQIEIIRGPGSVLYGTNAYSGVIDIKTKHPLDDPEYKTSFGFGSFNTRLFEASASKAYGENGSALVAFNSNESDGWDYETIDIADVQGEFKTGDRYYSAFADLNYKNFTFNIFDGYTGINTLGTSPVFPADRLKQKQIFADIGYTHRFNDKWFADMNVTYNNTSLIVSDQSVVNQAHNVLSEVTVHGEISDDINVILGATYNDLRASQKAVPTNPVNIRNNSLWKGYYAQADYNITEHVKITAGAQLNDDGVNDIDLSPRFGVVADFNDNWGAKLLYGKAFRSPYAFELAVDLPNVIIGNPALEPETIVTYDAQIYYQDSHAYAALTFFNSTLSDSVGLARVPPVLTYVNSEDIQSKGFELEGKYNFSQVWAAQGSLSHQTSENPAGESDVKLGPNFMAKLGVSYNKDGYSVGIFDNYFGEVKRRAGLPLTNPDSKDYHHVTVNVSLDLSKLYKLKSWPQTDVSFYADNLLESDVIYGPDIVRGDTNTFPQRPERSFYAKLALQF